MSNPADVLKLLDELDKFKSGLSKLDRMNFETFCILHDSKNLLEKIEDGEFKTMATIQIAVIQASENLMGKENNGESS